MPSNIHDAAAGVRHEPNCNRVLRGSSWLGNPRSMRAAFRNGIHPDYRFNGYGFRVARDLPAARTN